jgi:NADH:ubiquinone reductase (H+-translocating)
MGTVGKPPRVTDKGPVTVVVPEPAPRPHVVIIGGGFAGLQAAKTVARQAAVGVTLIDRRNHHLFQPLLYQVATAGLNPSDIAHPIRSQFANRANVAIRLGEVDRIDLGDQYVACDDVRIGYDFLVLACGAQHSYFGRPEWEPVAPGLKTLEQALEIRRRILSAFETAESEPDSARQRALLNFVIVGGGPTGVELAGAIADISRTVLLRDFRRIDPTKARVILVEAAPRLLGAFPEKLAERAVRDLASLGVEVLTSSPVEQVDANGVWIDGKQVEAATVLWAAGVQASALGRTLGVELDSAGRIKVAADLSLAGHPEVFVAGDMAHVDLGDGKPAPGLAPAAIQMGRTVGRNILASLSGKPRTAFRYRDKGMMATIGKHNAIAQAGRIQLTGFVAWLSWLFVHILYLVGVKNRIAVFLVWAWSYAFSKRGARLITSPEWRTHGGSSPSTAAR